MEHQYRVMGVRRFNDEVEGKRYDFTKVRIEMPVPRSAENEVGVNVVEAIIGKSDVYAEYAKLPFPGLYLVDLELTSRGFEVFSLKPVEGVKSIDKPAKVA